MPPPKNARPAASSVPSLVKDLVDQFDRPLDFYRELIQNSIDAGANRVDVSLDYADGKAVIRVEDDGEGMDENIIDNYLLVLFSSTKENDFTKIGKFGIGFVSVFAPRPDMVRVYTAKNGQSWRLDFPSYQHYDKYRLSEMREGTLIELDKAMEDFEYADLVQQSRKAISYWCKHSEVRLYFQNKAAKRPPELLSEEFDLPGGSSLRYKEEGTEIVLGFAPDEEPFCGFYNKGLTLKEQRKALFPGVQVKAKSRYLEHTLTRDNVLEDENYGKLYKIIQRLVDEQLPLRLKEELGAASTRIASAASGAAAGPLEAENEGWRRRLPFLRCLFSGYFSRWKRSEWPLFPAVSGRVLSLKETTLAAADADGKLYFDAGRNPVTDHLDSRGLPALVEGRWVEQVAAWLSVETVQASKAFILPRVVPDGVLPAPMRAFLAALRALDARAGGKYAQILAADFDYPGSCISSSLFVTQKTPGELESSEREPVSSLFWLSRARQSALIHAKHPFARRMCALHERFPELATFLALKMMRLYDGKAPPEQQGEYCNLAEKAETELLEGALRLDGRGR
jgi:hypothetical protein